MSVAADLKPPPGYGPVEPLDRTRHRGLGLKSPTGYGWYRAFNAVSVSLAEFARAALDYPIVFVRDAASGDPLPMAVLGLQQHQNLFVSAAGQWRAGCYVPAYLRRHPFCLAQARAPGGAELRPLVCVEEGALVPGGRPLLDERGDPTPDWTPILKLLEAIESTRPATVALVRRLDTLQLLAPFDALALPREGGQLRLQGMLRVDEERLKKLPGKNLKAMLGQGELRAIYAHLLSLENFARLLDLSQEA